jgi:Tfp pilus assembly protein PilO
VTPRWRRLLVPVLVLLGLNLAAFLTWTLPRILQERSLNARAATLGQELERAHARVREARERARTLETNARDERQFLDHVVGDRRKLLVPMLQEVIHTAEKHGLQPRSQGYKRGAVRGLPAVTRFDITIPMEGGYPQLAAFVQEMERSSYFVTVETISLGQTRSDEGPSASLDIRLATYFRAEPEDAEAQP